MDACKRGRGAIAFSKIVSARRGLAASLVTDKRAVLLMGPGQK